MSLCDDALSGAPAPTKGLLCEWVEIGIAAAIAAGVGGAAAGAMALANGVYPWEDPLKFMKSEAIGIGTGAVGGALGGAAGVAIGPLLGGGVADGAGSYGVLLSDVAGGATSHGGLGGAATGAVGGGFGAAGGGAAGGGIGAAGGAVEGGLGGAAIGSGTGTVAAEAGAALPQNLSGMVSSEVGQTLSNVGSQGTQAAIEQALPKAGGSFTDGMFQNAIHAAPKNIIGGALSGAVKDYQHPLRGALTGAASGLASSAVNVGAGALMRGQTAGMFNTTPVRDVQFNYNPDAPAYSIARDQLLSPTRGFSLGMTVQQPGVGGRLIGMGTQMGSRFASGAAGMGVQQAMTPPPAVPPANPYGMYGNNYLSRYNT